MKKQQEQKATSCFVMLNERSEMKHPVRNSFLQPPVFLPIYNYYQKI
jgi:hypothetical protein